MAFDPPSVQHAQTWNSVHRRFHPARPRRLHRREWRIEPHIDASTDQSRQDHVIIAEIGHSNPASKSIAHLMYSPDQLLPLLVPRMGLPGKHNLERPRLLGNPLKPFKVVEDQGPSLVGGGASCKSDRQNVPVETRIGLAIEVLDQRALD